MNNKPEGHRRGTKPETEARYRAALEMYRTTTLSIIEICRLTHTPASAFRSFVCRVHRELMFAHNGIEISKEAASSTRLHERHGQTAATRAKYGEAIAACGNIEYIKYTVSDIARIFHLDPSGLGQQLRTHYPEILEFREKERNRLGVNDNLHRGMKPWCREQYAEAVEHLRTTDDTIRQTAGLYNIPYAGLREHLLYYHKELVRKRADKRKRAKSSKKRGALTGSGTRHEPSPEQVEKYREAVRLYRTTAMTQKEIVAATGVTMSGLRNYLRIWNRELIVERRGFKCRKGKEINLSETKHYLKSTAAKYAGAIQRLKATGLPTAVVAREFGLNPEPFRMYLHEHEPELAARLGMTRLPNGKEVSARSAKKYEEAIRLYESTTESLKSIARRLGLQYNSVGGFIRRNFPEVIEIHNNLLAK